MRGMRLAGGSLIAIAVLTYWIVACDLAATAPLHPVGFWQYISAFFGYWWPYAIVLVIGVILWRRKPKNWLW
jgi:hypothetical protein